MVLSDENIFNQKSGLAESPQLNTKATSTSKTSAQRSWARVVTKNRKSLLHSTNSSSTANMVTSTSSTLDAPMISKTSRKESKIEFLHLVPQQYPSRVGVLTQQVGTLKFAEINFAPDDDALSECLANGTTFADKSIILRCRALDTHMQVVRLRLSNLPFLNEKAMMKDLEKSLRKYGDILDVGILLEPTTGTYMCTGYAVLNVASKTETFEYLTHLIPWDEQRECGTRCLCTVATAMRKIMS
ncbi:hypothetical protein G6F63_012814 [Rhizopus arrhizus]|nr:hypothetical protein G6F63_012814 [Rhizopus arrhizus]KAG1402690.1 hypothetical protein G6F59_012860 [Rhizopus arrhizus]